MSESKELIVVEEPVKPPPTYREIKANDWVALKRKGVENAPKADTPFWLVAGDGIYINRSTILGRGFIKKRFLPDYLPKLGGDYFEWNPELKVPAEILSKTISFFRRIWEKHETEAEVILLLHPDTKEWDIFVPLQKVSGTAVDSAFDPKDIPEGYLIVGSIHSHCNFNPFHSGTDLGDAEDMDGVHMTFGYVDRPEFEAVAMVMLNGISFDYKPSELGDFENIDTTIVAPEEWDEKVIPSSTLVSKHMPQNYKEVFDKYGKKPPAYSAPSVYTPSNYTGNWDRWDEDFWVEYENWKKGPIEDIKKKASLDAPHWEDHLDQKLIDAILDCELFTEEDMTRASENPANAQDIMWWRALFLMKLGEASRMLGLLGYQVDYKAFPKNKEQYKKEAENSEQLAADLLPESAKDYIAAIRDEKPNLAKRLESEGFTVLEIKEDGTVVIDSSKV